MDRNEKLRDLAFALRQAVTSNQSEVWTSLPAIVVSFDPVQLTCQLQPTIQARVQRTDTKWEWVNLPVLVDCPVVFPGGGGVVMTFPVEPGDEVLVVFSSRCIDNWWISGGIKPQAELRMHDLSDGFCLPGLWSVPRVPVDVSPAQAELRTTNGDVRVSVNPTTNQVGVITPGDVNVQAGGDAEVVSSGAVSVTAPEITITGNVTITGNTSITGILSINGTDYSDHQHTMVSSGTELSGGVAP